MKGMDFKVIEDNRFLIRFNHVLNCNRVLDRCPWAYKKCLILVAKVEEDQNPPDMSANSGLWGSSLRSATPFGTWLRTPPPSGPRARNDSHASIRVFPPSVVSSARRAFLLVVLTRNPSPWLLHIWLHSRPPQTHGDLDKLRGLENLVHTHHPSLVFIVETKCNNSRIDHFQSTIAMPQFYVMMIGIVGILRASMAPLRQGIIFRHGLSYPDFRLNLVVLGFVRMFPETTVTHLDSALSDHAPIIISTTGYVVTPTALSRPWRSEAHWLQGPECEEADLRDKLDAWYARQELYWQQRRKIHWLRDGDRNTSFFHAKASSRRRVNAIDRLRDEGGRWIDDPAALRRLIERHFSRVFNSDQPSTTEIEGAWNTLHAELKH
ncbi:UNVERIFIED_CONTAM: hypothetical protein Scaly_3091100 [Sesamum calycinum]|uniref:DUF4283 domain-containing protein n=1 Tax=Sesamum calycinum TaxID=2727403 RepID=A0AAW2JNY7_9LAMI